MDCSDAENLTHFVLFTGIRDIRCDGQLSVMLQDDKFHGKADWKDRKVSSDDSFVLYSYCCINFITRFNAPMMHDRPAVTTWNTPQGGSVVLQITLGTQPLKFVVTGDGSEASLMWLSAGALACIQDDGCFTLVCGDSSLCLCLTKCQQVSYSKIWHKSRIHILQLPYCVTDLHTTLSRCNASVLAFNICRQDAILSVQCLLMLHDGQAMVRNRWVYLTLLLTEPWWEFKINLLSFLCKNPAFGYIVSPAFMFLTLVTI